MKYRTNLCVNFRSNNNNIKNSDTYWDVLEDLMGPETESDSALEGSGDMEQEFKEGMTELFFELDPDEDNTIH